MSRNEFGYTIGGIGLGILLASVIYPLGYLESKSVFSLMSIIGSSFIFISLFIRKSKKEQTN
ncbi:hypothetical protein ACFPYN_13130 [Paenisporosarcina macmurdoensis]|uniref:Uncharacterized protein n=1 Tax=Paenisporosarcina macmurdoensis TaxID=212659 RepID=A0ABW1L9Y8_9BACL